MTPGEGGYIYDDQGGTGGLATGERFVIVGDYNADPNDGDSVDKAIQQLLFNPSVDASVVPTSAGGDCSSRPCRAPRTRRTPGIPRRTRPTSRMARRAIFAPTMSCRRRSASTRSAAACSGRSTPIRTFRWWGRSTRLSPAASPAPTIGWCRWISQVEDDQRREVADIDFLGEVTFPTGLMFDGNRGRRSLRHHLRSRPRRLLRDFRRSQPDQSGALLHARHRCRRRRPRRRATSPSQTSPRCLMRTASPLPARLARSRGHRAHRRGRLHLLRRRRQRAGRRLSSICSRCKASNSTRLPIDAKVSANRQPVVRHPQQSRLRKPDGHAGQVHALYRDGERAVPGRAGSGPRQRVGLPHRQVRSRDGPADRRVRLRDRCRRTPPNPAGSFANNGLVDLLAIDDDGTLLAIERAFSTGVGNSIKIYQVLTQGATDVSGVDAVETEIDDGELAVEPRPGRCRRSCSSISATSEFRSTTSKASRSGRSSQMGGSRSSLSRTTTLREPSSPSSWPSRSTSRTFRPSRQWSKPRRDAL